MAAPPQADRNAPSGPDKPQMRTLASRTGVVRPKVVVKIRYADEMPASTPQA